MKFIVSGLLAFSFSITAQASDKSVYESIKGNGTFVQYSSINGDLLIGSSIFEKTKEGVLCQKTGAVVPNPKYSYTCYSEINTSSAEAIYEALAGDVQNVSFLDDSGIPLLGASTQEKRDGDIFCRKSGAVVPTPEYSYNCFAR